MRVKTRELKHRSKVALRRAEEEPLLYARILGLEARDTISLSEKTHAGFSYRTVIRFQNAASLSTRQIAEVLLVPLRTMARRREQGRLRPDESDRLLRATRVFAKALALFEGNREAAKQWLTTPKVALRGRTPFDLARTDVGAREVETLVDRVEHGVFS
ncbi:MAG TPA: antitoxin Xre/MbcA/ParS toxin-binding domain-containing protein [Candidatus Methylomirabilis sp.]|nr:antitoxin Xre/MbcA/ParS toxin-binding domain-containing protein [Candidatus Methylomirabilis sp.]